MADLEGILGASPQGPMKDTPARKLGRPKGAFRHDFRASSLIDPHKLASDPEIEQTIKFALEGRLVRSRPLKSYEPQKLNARHISVVLMKVVGLPNNSIGRITGYTDRQVSVILGHPDALTLLHRCLAKTTATAATDITARLKEMSPQMLQVVEDIALDDEEKGVTRLRAAFGWLDRAGYGATQKIESTQHIVVEKSHATLLSNAIREAGEIQEADYVIVGGAPSGSTSPVADDVQPPASATNLGDTPIALLPPAEEEVA